MPGGAAGARLWVWGRGAPSCAPRFPMPRFEMNDGPDMNGFPQLALGVIGTLAFALFLILCSASALQAWHSSHKSRLSSAAVDTGPAPAAYAPAVSSYWAGRG